MRYHSAGMKKRGRSSSSWMETQYLCPNSKKPRVDYRKSFSSSRGKAYEVMGSVSDDRFSKDSKFVRDQETLKKRFDHRIIVKAEELEVAIGRRNGHQKVDSMEMQKKKNQIMEKNKADGVGFSDSKAARVETLKKRFGRIIAKSEFQVEDRRSDHYYHKDDYVEMQRKKNQILEKKLKEAEVVAEAESKMELQKKREAAKKALVELEKSVEVEDNVRTMKDFVVMLGYPRNCPVYLCNEIGWYGAPVMVHSRRSTLDEDHHEEGYMDV